MIKAKLESVTFGDFTKYVDIPENLIKCENTREMIINHILCVCKNFRKYGTHKDEKFIIWYK